MLRVAQSAVWRGLCHVLYLYLGGLVDSLVDEDEVAQMEVQVEEWVQWLEELPGREDEDEMTEVDMDAWRQ